MSKFLVFQEKGGKLFHRILEEKDLPYRISYELELFEADAHCDYVMNMVRINAKYGHRDAYWNDVEEHIKKEGI